jgi:aminoglycoside phosphotransferase (APT) family kinase protein
MSTIGHPLSDLSNLFAPYVFASSPSTTSSAGGGYNTLAAFSPHSLYHPSSHPHPNPYPYLGMPTRQQATAWYAAVSGWDPAPEASWGDAFAVFRNSVIMQGIAARYALRNASSAEAKKHGEKMPVFGEFAWKLVGKVRAETEEKARKAKL